MHQKIMTCMILLFIAALAATMTESLYAEAYGIPALNPLGSLCNPVPDTINVRLRDHYSDWSNTPRNYTAPIEEYAYGVALGELGGTVLYGPNAGQAWDAQVIKAQAIAARTWGTYNCHKWTLPDGRTGVFDGGSDAQFRPYYTGVPSTTISKFQTQSAVTKGMYLTWDDFLLAAPYDGKIIDAQFRNDVGNPTCSWNSGNDNRIPCLSGGNIISGYDYLTSMDNQFAWTTSGPGFGQISAQGWRKADKKKSSYADVLHKYYTGVWIQDDYYANYSEKFYSYSNGICGSTVLWQGTTRNINYYWASIPPNRPGVPADNFCVKWETNLNISAADWYTLYILRDDGMRLYVDGNLIFDQWNNTGAKLQSVGVFLTQGAHTIRLDYYDAGYDAVARLSINRSVGMIGRYFNYKVNATGNIPSDYVMTRPDTPTKFDWVNASPQDTHSGYEPYVTEIPSNYFSVIWEGYIHVDSCGDVSFQGRMDDGMYAVLTHPNGSVTTLINDYNPGGMRTLSSAPHLCDGTYKVEVRYFEQTLNAIATFDWWYSGNAAPETDTEE